MRTMWRRFFSVLIAFAVTAGIFVIPGAGTVRAESLMLYFDYPLAEEGSSIPDTPSMLKEREENAIVKQIEWKKDGVVKTGKFEQGEYTCTLTLANGKKTIPAESIYIELCGIGQWWYYDGQTAEGWKKYHDTYTIKEKCKHPKTEKTYIYLEDASCKPGRGQYVIACKDCGEIQEYLDEYITFPPDYAHTFEAVSSKDIKFKWSEDLLSCKAYAKCEECGTKVKYDCKVTRKILKKATAGKPGQMKVTAKAVFGGTFKKSKTGQYLIRGKLKSAASPKKKQMKVSWKTVKSASGYKVQYAESKDFSKAKTVTVTGSGKKTKTIKKLKSGVKYYVRVRPIKTIGNTTIYGDWSKKKSTVVK